jgi:methionyl-tRNA synthetase
MVDRHNADLANGLGNLASRVLAMLGSSFDGAVPAPPGRAVEEDLAPVVADAGRRFEDLLRRVQITSALAAVWEIVDRANGYLVEKEPWKIARDEGRREELASVLYAAAETLRILAILISPVMPSAAGRLWTQLGIEEPLAEQRLPDALAWGRLAPGTRTTKGDSLFPRLES